MHAKHLLFILLAGFTARAFGDPSDRKGAGNVDAQTPRITIALDQPAIATKGQFSLGFDAADAGPWPVIIGGYGPNGLSQVSAMDNTGHFLIKSATTASSTYVGDSIFMLGALNNGSGANIALRVDQTDATSLSTHDPELGYVGDAAATGGGTGTVSAKLREVTLSLGDINDGAVSVGGPGSVAGKLRLATGLLGDTTAVAVLGDNPAPLNGHLRGIAVELGNTTDSAATTDTATASVIALLKRLNQHMNGAPTIATGQATLSTSFANIAAARATRRKITITNLDASIKIYVGNTGVATNTGMLIAAGASLTLDTNVQIFGIAASGSPIVSFVEIYD